ncbi:uncharacterized protein KLLA0_D16192g [Kluyveromyces lactis]|uniref:KLLA0D16192p n=1 Tax=Kluyveromyces lactis (strain ATCC 8585 / CBS 2359 / DSM 70799 / NBRC 1267 / NRRL Y-1140 / WM37) TaxID=284590 RepID=Q6CQL5_KLULA|nr:uncharacterized protein KLLA0_D16192g [Kluyveromyces lactis]CAH00870.1 KLLA0D16192p [Kluyveromyces lactis]|eukprot:XP_453774.1 uncharacterized protein KLLA0_D16192g [Kluyveromyces lactis]
MPKGIARVDEKVSVKASLPDLRFEQTFKQSLRKEALKQNKLTLSVADGSVVDPPITPYIVAKVVARDILISPFLQGVFLSLFYIVAKPWLQYCRQAGRNIGRSIIRNLFGKNAIYRPPRNI